MFLFYVLSFFKKGDVIQGRTLFKEIRYKWKFENLPHMLEVNLHELLDNVGKSSIIKRFLHGTFDINYVATGMTF